MTHYPTGYACDEHTTPTFTCHLPELRTIGGEILILCHCGEWASRPGLPRFARLAAFRLHVIDAVEHAVLGGTREGVESIATLEARLHKLRRQISDNNEEPPMTG